MKIAVAGTGYVGLSLATLLSQNNEVIALDVMPEKVEKINNRISPIKDKEIEDFFKVKDLNLKATLDYKEAFEGAKFIIISTPTNYDDEKNHFDTSSVEDIIQKVISMNINTTMVVKSTIPVGFIKAMNFLTLHFLVTVPRIGTPALMPRINSSVIGLSTVTRYSFS